MKRFAWTKQKIETTVSMTLDGKTLDQIAARIGCTEPRTVRRLQIETGIGKSKKPLIARKEWKARELAKIRREYPTVPGLLLARSLGCTLSQLYRAAHQMRLKKSDEVIAQMARERIADPNHPSRRYRYPKGNIPANKGLRRPGYAPGRMADTQFKKNERSGVAAEKWKPIGTVVADAEGFLRVKIAERINGEPKGWAKEIWPLLHWRTWEEHHGPIPPGHKVVFKDGDRANCAIENLELLSNAEMMLRNSIHNLPEELKDTIMLLGRVKRKVRENAEKHDDRSAQPSVRSDGVA
jgi:hypothetical protein